AMGIRRDALVTAGRFLVAVHEETQSWPGRQVATVGRIEAHPGAPNVIPGAVDLSLQIRDLEMETIEALYQRFQELGRELARRNQTEITFEPYYLSRAAPCDPVFMDAVEAAANDLGFSNLRLPSGAGHDAQSIAVLAPVGLIFIPSRDGISHSPREFTSVADVTNGTRVLLETLRRLDGVLG
ncbi:MAG: M20/M25/M40 family metallo-hydrolase, partial [Rhodospirillales bacterium]|nr:M20/M25/M40 family metallo-hydrolase [Rhodospirillales bacterium]